MKSVLLFIVLMMTSLGSFATQQAPDYLTFRGEQLRLETSWAYPSILEIYYQQNQKASPFEMGSTANYRGHIAYWEIQNDRLYLRSLKVSRRQGQQHPSEFDIQSTSPSPSTSGSVWADWFSGVLMAESRQEVGGDIDLQGAWLFHFRHGKLLDQDFVSAEEMETLYLIGSDTNKGSVIGSKRKMYDLFRDYTDYYFRLSEPEWIQVGEEKAQLDGKGGAMSSVMGYFDYDHLQWPYNWENRQRNGAPNGDWQIVDGSIYLTGLSIRSGGNLYQSESETVSLTEMFDSQNTEQGVLGHWLNGVFAIFFGESSTKGEPPYAYEDFIQEEVMFVRVKDGVIQQQRRISMSMDLQSILTNQDQVLTQLYKEYVDYQDDQYEWRSR